MSDTSEQPTEEAAPTAVPEPAVAPPAESLVAAPEVDEGSPASAGLPMAEPAAEPQPLDDEPVSTGGAVESVDTAVADPAAPGSASGRPPRAPEPTPAETAAALASLFPALFGGPGPKPVKLRIQADIQARAPGQFNKKTLSIFLHRHTTSTGYLKALVADGAQRIDLDGAPAGEIDPVHLEAARVELARRWEIVLAKRAAERANDRGPGRGPERSPRPSRPPPGAAVGAPVEAAAAEGVAAGAAADPAAMPSADRRPRQDRPPHGERPPQPPRPPRADGQQRPPRDEGARRPPRPDRPEGRAPARADGWRDRPGPGGPRPDRPPHRDGAGAGGAGERRGPPPETAVPTDPAQRERLMLLRAFEASPLKKANFCALKRISEADLDQQLALARQELAARKG